MSLSDKAFDYLRKARVELHDTKRWTTGQLAKTTKGDMTFVTDPSAVCWCIIGMLCHLIIKDAPKFMTTTEAINTEVMDEVLIALRNSIAPVTLRRIRRYLAGHRIAQPTPRAEVSAFNDMHEHIDVLRLLDRTIMEEEIKRDGARHTPV